MIPEKKSSCIVHGNYDDNCPWCRVEHKRAKREGEYVDVKEESIAPDDTLTDQTEPREKEVMVEEWRDVETVKKALGLRGQPFHAKVEGNGVMFAYPQLKNDVEEGGQSGND